MSNHNQPIRKRETRHANFEHLKLQEFSVLDLLEFLLIADDPEVAQPFEQGIKLSLNPRIYRKDNIERTSPRGEQRLARYFGQGMGVGCETPEHHALKAGLRLVDSNSLSTIVRRHACSVPKRPSNSSSVRG